MTKRKRSNSSDTIDNFPTLLQLSCRNFARGLWLHVIKRTTLPIESSKLDQSFLERCKNEVLEILNQNGTMIPSDCKTTVVAQVSSLVRNIIDELSPLIISRLMSHVLETPKWKDFASSIWSCVKDQVPQQRIVFMFEWIVMKVDKIGLEAVPEDELAVYLEIWTNLPNHLKISIFENSSYHYSRRRKPWGLMKGDTERMARLKNLPRDLRFLQKLFADFDLPTRKQIWRENWLYLIFGASLTSLESLMKMCCQTEDEIEQFKNEWLARNEIIDHYYSPLIEWECYAELNQYLSFYSTIESKIFDLAENILHSYFSRNVLHYLGVDSYSDVVRIARCGGWLGKAIKLSVFEHYLRKDEVKMRMQCCLFLHKGSFDEIRDFVAFFLPEEEVIMYERRLLRFFFLDNSSPILEIMESIRYHSTLYFSFVPKLDEFNAFINRVFPSADEAAAFKKDIIFSQFMREGLRDYLDSFSSHESIFVQKFVMMCLPCEQDLSRWKDKFMEDALQSIRLPRHLGGLYRMKDNIMLWCLDSKAKVIEFKAKLPIDEIFLVMKRYLSGSSGDVYTLKDISKSILKWWFNDNVQEMADFKMSKLRKCADDDPMLDVFLDDRKNMYLQTDDDELRRWLVLASCIPRQ